MCSKLISVVICTHNPDTHVLQMVIDALALQTLDPNRVEYLLIANACEPAAIESAIDWKGVAFKIIHEPKLGAANARRRGIQDSHGDYIAFIDDDNIPDPDYLTVATDFLEANPAIGVVGGRSDAVSSMPLPFWFGTYAGQYAVGVQEIDSADVTIRGFVWGAGMVFRAPLVRALVAAGIPSLLSGRSGTVGVSGEDAELCQWFVAAGYRLYYDERLHFLHYMAPARLTKNYFKAMSAGHAASGSALAAYGYAITAPPLFSRSWWAQSLKAYARCLVSLGRQIPAERLEALRAFPFKTLSPEVANAVDNVRRIRHSRATLRT